MGERYSGKIFPQKKKQDGSRDPLSYFTPYYNTWKGETGLSNEDNDALN